jgi:histidinol phosphatase-like enzyme
MNIIFLDIDGVLNSQTFYFKRSRNTKDLKMIDTSSLQIENENVKSMLYEIDVDNLEVLKQIVEMTNSKIVVISSWKKLPYFKEASLELVRLGLPIIDVTIDNGSNRGEGIKNYLSSHKCKNYIVIDDDVFPDYDEEIMQHLVKTSFYESGLREQHIDVSVKKLTMK